MFKKDYDENKAELLYQSLSTSSQVNKKLFNTYIFFLIVVLIALLNLSDVDYLKNENVKFLFVNIDVTVDQFLLVCPYIIVLFHIGVLESLIIHKKKIMKYYSLKTKLLFDEKKEIYLYPFVFNDKSNYIQTNTISITNLFAILVFLALPLITLYHFIRYYNDILYLILMVCILLCLNGYTLYKFGLKKLMVILWVLCSLFLVSWSLYENYKVNVYIASLNEHNIVESSKEKSKTVEKEKVLDNEIYIKVVSFLEKHLFDNRIYIDVKKFIYEDINSLKHVHQNFNVKDLSDSENKIMNHLLYDKFKVDNRSLTNFFFYKSDLINTNFVRTDLKRFEFSELNLVNNIFFNSDLEDIEFHQTNLIKQKFLGDYINIDEVRFKSKLSNIVFFTGNNISQTLFQNIEMENIDFIGKNIIENTKFVGNHYKNVKFNNVEFINTTFEKKNIGIPKNQFQSIILDKKKDPSYREKDYGNLIEKSKANMFSNVKLIKSTFKNITIENLLFQNTLFQDVRIEGKTFFRNVTFEYIGKANSTNESFFRNIKECFNCKYIDYSSGKLLINNYGKVNEL